MQPRKSLELHALSGTRPHYTDDAKTEPAFHGGKPKMPVDLTPEQQVQWKWWVKVFHKRRVLTLGDSPALEMLVRMWSRWKVYAKLAEANPLTTVTWVDKNGAPHEKIVEHPASNQATRLEASLRNMLKEFSATPASREKTKPTAQAPAKNAPPHPDSCAGVGQELERLRVLQAAQPPEQEPEAEIDVNAIKIPEEL